MRPCIITLVLLVVLAISSQAQHFLMEKDGSSFAIWTPPEGGTVPFLHFRNQANAADWILRHDNAKFHIQTEGPPGSEKMTFLTNGRVGIGTTNPLEMLHVTGRTQSSNTTIGSWPAGSRYAFFGTNGLDQTLGQNYALLQDSQGSSTGQTFLNSPVDIRFRIGNVDQLILANNGRLGIGTTNPEAKTDILFNSSTSTPHLLLRENNIVDFARISFENTSSSNFWTLAGMTSGNHPISEFNLFYNGYGNILSAKGNGDLRVFGRLGINEPTPTATLQIKQPYKSVYGAHIPIDGISIEENTSLGNDSWYIYANNSDLNFAFNGFLKASIKWTGEYLEISDEGIKSNINTLDPILNKVKNLIPSSFQYRTNQKDSTKTIGFIAQEVESIFPELVFKKNDLKTLVYSKFGVIAIKAIQEQQEIIEELLEKNNELEERLDDFQKQLDEVKSSVVKRGRRE